ncbi:MAG: ABC transporter permease [Alphaproteobacteria bacterium]
MDLGFLVEITPRLAAGVPPTLLLVVQSLALGFVLAVLLALVRLSPQPHAAGTAYGFVYVFRSTPLLVQLFLIYYGSGQFRGALEAAGLWFLFRDAWFCAVLALTLNTAAYTSEIIRGGLQSVPHGAIEAGRAIGMSGPQLFRRITFPIAIRQALPAYGNEIILMVKASSLASTITILEITGIAKNIIASSYRPVEVFLVAGAFYLTINFVVTRAVLLLERRLTPSAAATRRRAPVSTAAAQEGAPSPAGIGQ